MGHIAIKPGVFIRFDADTTPTPVLIDVSRSGREYPHDFRSPLPFTDLHDNVSMYVEDLYAIGPSLGASLLYACFPNTYVDTNRSAADIDETLIEGREWPDLPRREIALSHLLLLEQPIRSSNRSVLTSLGVERLSRRTGSSATDSLVTKGDGRTTPDNGHARSRFLRGSRDDRRCPQLYNLIRPRGQRVVGDGRTVCHQHVAAM